MSMKTSEEPKLDVGNLDKEKLIELALKNKSKKCAFTFKDMLLQLDDEEVDKMWEHLCNMIMQYEHISDKDNGVDGQSPKKAYQEISKVIQAVIEIADVMLSENIPLPTAFLRVLLYLNAILLDIPGHLENLKNNIAGLCEKFQSMNSIDDIELIVSNTLIYLLQKSTNPKAVKKDVKRIYCMRSLIPKIISLDSVDARQVWELLKKCAQSQLYSTLPESVKIISLSLTMDRYRTSDVHEAIKKRLSSCSVAHAIFFGKVYYDAWFHAVKNESERMKEVIEITCIQDLVLMAVTDRRKSVVYNTRKVLAQFHCKKKEINVLRMLYTLYHPILWLHLKHPDGLIRANAAQLFLDAFPLENPDLDLVSSDQELNEQMLMIKDLLVDDYPIVRCCTIIGLCLAMSVHWELFPEEILKTYFKILINDLSCDSSSSDVRCAIAKGFKGLLENPLTIPTLQNILPKLKNMFDDISSLVRVAFCQLLLSVKRVWGIRYYDIVPLNHLLARMEEDPAVSKLIVNLIHNSYFPKNEHPNVWLTRCADMVKTNRDSSREFFRYVPRYIGVDAGAKFMVHTIKTVHFYIKSKSSSATPSNSSDKRAASQKKAGRKRTASQKRSAPKKSLDASLNESGDAEILESAVGFQDPEIVSGLVDAVAILWLSCNLAKPENKNQLKLVVGNLSKWMEDLVLHYKDTPVWNSVFYLASLMPSENVPCLVPLCHEKLKSGISNGLEEEYFTLMQVLCNQREGGALLTSLREFIEIDFNQPRKPTPKRRKMRKNISNSTTPTLGLKLLNEMLDNRACQKIILVQHPDELKSFLGLINHLKGKIECFLSADLSEQESDFLLSLFLTISKIAVLLNSENFDCIKFMEDMVMWLQDKLCVRVWPKENSRGRNSQAPKCSDQIEKLVVNICRELCLILSDMIFLGLFNKKKCIFIKFGIQLLNFDMGASILLPVSKMLYKHVLSGSHIYLNNKKDNILQIVPDCLKKIHQYISKKEMVSRIPTSTLKDIELVLNETIKLLKKCDRSFSNLSFAFPSLGANAEKATDNKSTGNNDPLSPDDENRKAAEPNDRKRKSKRLSFAVPSLSNRPESELIVSDAESDS